MKLSQKNKNGELMIRDDKVLTTLLSSPTNLLNRLSLHVKSL